MGITCTWFETFVRLKDSWNCDDWDSGPTEACGNI